MDSYTAALDHAAERLGVFIEGQARAQWPSSPVRYTGAAAFGSRCWEIEAPQGMLRLAVSEPALAAGTDDELALLLERADWLSKMVAAAAEGDGLLVTADGRLFIWDARRDRGIRLITG